jgi:TP901 family phage tail tape measure protein
MSAMGFGGLPPILGILTLSISEFEAKLGEARLQMRETARMGSSTLGGGAGGLGGMVKTGLLAAAVAAVAFGAESVKMAAKFSSSMEQVHTQAGASQHEVDALKGKVLALAPAVGAGPQQLAEALYHVESVGFRGAKAMDVLAMSARLAKVGHADLEATSNALAAAFVTQAKDTRTAAQAAGILNAIIGQGNMRMEDMVGALSTGLLPVARNVGLGLTDVGAALAVMTDRGMRADEAATRLKMTLSLVTAPTDKAKKALKDMGLEAFTLAHDLRQPDGLSVMLNDLHEHLSKLGPDARAADISAIFGGGRSSAAIQTLLNGLGAYDSKLGEIKRHTGDFGEAWRATSQQAAFKWDQLKAGAQSFMILVGTGLINGLTSFASHVASAVRPQVAWLITAWKDNREGIEHWMPVLRGLATVLNVSVILAIKGTVAALAGIAIGLGKAGNAIAGWERFILAAFGFILHAAVVAFSWAPWLGPKLRDAEAKFDAFRHHILATLDGTAAAARKKGAAIGSALAAGLYSQVGKVAAAAVAYSAAVAAGIAKAPGGGGTNYQANRQMAAGGVLTEPVVGVGMRTGIQYTLAERGPEAVTPLQGGHGGGMAVGVGGAGGGGMTTIVNVNVAGFVHGSSEQVARELWRLIHPQMLQYGKRNTSVLSGMGVTG